MNQMPISECYLPKFNIQPHYHRLIVYIHEVRMVFQLRMVFQTQVPISLVILVIGIQDLYTSKYKYTISRLIYSQKIMVLMKSHSCNKLYNPLINQLSLSFTSFKFLLVIKQYS